MVVAEKNLDLRGELLLEGRFPWSYVVVVGGDARLKAKAQIRGSLFVGRDLRLDAPSEITCRLKVGGRGEIFDSLRIKDVTLAFQAQTIALEDEQGKPLFVAHNAELESPDGKIKGNLAVLATEPVTTPIKGDLLSFYASLTEEDRQKLIVVMGSSTTEGVPDFYIERGGSGILSFLVQAKKKLEESGLQGVQLKRLIYFYPLDLYAEFTATNFTLLPIFVNPDNSSLKEVLTPEKVAGYEEAKRRDYATNPTKITEFNQIREGIWNSYEERAKERPLPETAPTRAVPGFALPEWCIEPVEKDPDACSRTQLINYVGDQRGEVEQTSYPEPWPANQSYVNQTSYQDSSGNWVNMPDFYCGPVAAAMIAVYWDIVIDKAYCFGFGNPVTTIWNNRNTTNPFAWDSDMGVLGQLINAIGIAAGTNNWYLGPIKMPGTYPEYLASGARTVLNASRYRYQYASGWGLWAFPSSAFDRVESWIKNDQPIIVAYVTEWINGGHYMAALGYRKYLKSGPFCLEPDMPPKVRQGL
jgi:hypothetical protein